jgi:trans-aconitate 2-methyltransferase
VSWNPNQYERFKSERRQPFDDLLALVEKRPRMRVVDLGCGTGELTRDLHDHLGAEETIGIDNSETMLLKSSAFGDEILRFEQGEIEAFVADRPFDLIFSNAALHWVNDHPTLFRRLAGFLSPRGQIAIQMPANETHASHRVAAEVASDFGITPRQSPILAPEDYASLLYALGASRQHVRLQIYGHVLPSSGDVVEWVKGTLLTDYERQLDKARFADFVKEYRTRLLREIGEASPYFYTYRRVLMWATF